MYEYTQETINPIRSPNIQKESGRNEANGFNRLAG
jgi:hypothetical protein